MILITVLCPAFSAKTKKKGNSYVIVQSVLSKYTMILSIFLMTALNCLRVYAMVEQFILDKPTLIFRFLMNSEFGSREALFEVGFSLLMEGSLVLFNTQILRHYSPLEFGIKECYYWKMSSVRAIQISLFTDFCNFNFNFYSHFSFSDVFE